MDKTDKKTVRILVVDDDLSLRTLIAKVLTEDGHLVTAAGSGEEALEVFQKDPCPLVITDIIMGNLSGMDLLKKVTQLSPKTKVIVISSYTTPETRDIALRAGASDVLTKPFEDIGLISAAVDRVLDT